jgi:hypothetical protein
MALELGNFQDANLTADYVAYLVDQQSADAEAHYGRLWDYFRNPLVVAAGAAADALNESSRPYFQAQETGLPARITGVRRHGGRESLTDLRRKEVVIENDIAWRVHTMIDFLFGKPVTIRSLADDPQLARLIEQAVAAILDGSGGMSFFQELALYGAVYGFVDVALRTPADGSPEPSPPQGAGRAAPDASASQADRRPGTPDNVPGARVESPGQARKPEDGRKDSTGDRSRSRTDRVLEAARGVQLETVEAPRILPILDEDDYRRVRYWIQRYHKRPPRLDGTKRSWLRLPWTRRAGASPAVVEIIEILGANWWQRYEDRLLVAEGPNSLGRAPIVHVQNVALPGAYEGLSDVEPLVPLQDELNTRLSDRAHRVTYQSFKMYLGKGIDDFLERPVGPGQMWSTANLQASIEEFGSDSGSPSEDAHIEQVRAAMDKASGVTPLAAGLIRGNVGNLTSATALKVLLTGLLSRTEKKRLTYGAGIGQIVELALDWLDLAGVLRTSPRDRRVEVHWPNPLPADEGEALRNAQIKAALGVPAERILAELGYDRKTTDQAAQ